MFTINDKEYDQTTLSDKGRGVFDKLIRLGEQKADLDILINFWTGQLQAQLPKEELAEDDGKSE
tara:strand:- start:974 stop:1165 length:192 start_codon:yes stop_codon:yes gene_type:complete